MYFFAQLRCMPSLTIPYTAIQVTICRLLRPLARPKTPYLLACLLLLFQTVGKTISNNYSITFLWLDISYLVIITCISRCRTRLAYFHGQNKQPESLGHQLVRIVIIETNTVLAHFERNCAMRVPSKYSMTTIACLWLRSCEAQSQVRDPKLFFYVSTWFSSHSYFMKWTTDRFQWILKSSDSILIGRYLNPNRVVFPWYYVYPSDSRVK